MNRYHLVLIVRAADKPEQPGLLIRTGVTARDELTARKTALERAWGMGYIVLAFGEIRSRPLDKSF
ncbi:hypothetical protein LCGC14_0357340 [marine sediment metagenome]|uniref:Uncharacterized protein n=1 Tax=marine sediment metagenome TaxID=412755 RepID=A0A0F9T9A0_9ZZZZ